MALLIFTERIPRIPSDLNGSKIRNFYKEDY